MSPSRPLDLLARARACFDIMLVAGRRRVLRCAALGALLGLASACSDSDGKRPTEWLGDAAFGSAPPEFRPDGGPDGDPDGDLDAGEGNESVRLRVFHGVLNLPGVRFCFDPDYRVDDPYTEENEADAGAEPPVPILADLIDGGVVPLGEAAPALPLPGDPPPAPAYVMLSLPSAEGAITVHRAAPAGGADGGVSSGPADAGRDAGAADAAIDPCDPATIETVLPLPVPAAWLDPPRPASDAGSSQGNAITGDAGATDAGAMSAERRGLLSTLSGDLPITLFGSGRSLDPTRLADRGKSAADAYLMRNPGDMAGAAEAGRVAVAWLESALGPRFYLTRGVVPPNKNTAFGLTLVHLIPDVFASIDGGIPSDTSSGALHVCMRIGTLESDVAGGAITRVDFRNSLTFDPLDPKAKYVFRLFVEADFVRTQANCAVSSLKPVAEMTVDQYFKAGRSYTLVAWGARSASDLCTSYASDSVVRPGCAGPASNLGARIAVFDNGPAP